MAKASQENIIGHAHDYPIIGGMGADAAAKAIAGVECGANTDTVAMTFRRRTSVRC